jgi:hypothetical protein
MLRERRLRSLKDEPDPLGFLEGHERLLIWHALDLAETIDLRRRTHGWVGVKQQPNKLLGFCTKSRAFSCSVLPALAE